VSPFLSNVSLAARDAWKTFEGRSPRRWAKNRLDVRAALRTLEREEQRHEAKLAALRTAIDEGDASGIAEGKVFERVREKLNLPSTPR